MLIKFANKYYIYIYIYIYTINSLNCKFDCNWFGSRLRMVEGVVIANIVRVLSMYVKYSTAIRPIYSSWPSLLRDRVGQFAGNGSSQYLPLAVDSVLALAICHNSCLIIFECAEELAK